MPSYRGYRFPSEVISHAVWLYHRFCLSFRDAEDLLAQRSVTVTYEDDSAVVPAIRSSLRAAAAAPTQSTGRHLASRRVFVTIQGRQQYLWRAVDEDGDVLDILVQSHRNRRAAARFFRKLLNKTPPRPRGARPPRNAAATSRMIWGRAPYRFRYSSQMPLDRAKAWHPHLSRPRHEFVCR